MTDQAPVCIKDKEHAEDKAPEEVNGKGVPLIDTVDVYHSIIQMVGQTHIVES